MLTLTIYGLLYGASAQAKSWCAEPLVVHEWGVHVVRIDGGQASGTPLPSWFHRDAAGVAAASVPVRELPADSGIRDLPVLQFYSSRAPVPVALEVGFGAETAVAWWPEVDRLIPAAIARSPAALAARDELLAARAERDPSRPHPPLGPDPTKQLGWDRLSLSARSSFSLKPSEQPWVDALRAMPDALWVDARSEGDRFVFYEASTKAGPDLALERAESWSSSRPHYRVRNRSDFTAHDVLIIANGRVWTAPAVPPGATAGFLLDQPLDRAKLEEWFRARWLAVGSPPQGRSADQECVMMRDPAVPTDVASGYRLYGPELDVLFKVWADRMLSPTGVRLVYREDTDALDARMPLSVYTDMYHFIELSRLGVVVVEGVAL